ncbi:MAG: hypothetical protein ACE5LU_14185 [Anaerolineae bacterium]
MPNFGQISRLVSLVVAGLVLTALVEMPTWTLPLIVLDSPLTLRLSGPWLITAVLVILACAGTDVLLRLHPALDERGFRHTAPAWVVPGTMAAVAPFVIVQFEPWSVRWLLVLAGAGVGLSLALLGEVHAADPCDRHFHAARASLTTLAYATALLLFTAIYAAHVRTVLSGTAISLISFLLAMSLFRWSAREDSMLWPYAAPTALIVGLATWGLNHMHLDSLAGGGLLLLVFYLVTGVAQQLIQRDLSRRVLIEFAVAAVLGLLLIGLSARGG